MDFSDNYSKGCQACQKGKWLCIYLTYLCNASCSFCPAPVKDKDIVKSAFGNNPETILHNLNKYPFEGLSFSGGECFMVYDRLLSWLTFFKKYKPELYFWAYTNGLNLNEEQLTALKIAGLNELRFNIAAWGYNHPGVLKNLAISTKIFQHVAVEIPSIPGDREKLLKLLPKLDELGVDYLNLHEYILVPSDPSIKNAPKAEFVMNYDTLMQYHPRSIANTDEIKKLSEQMGLNIKINSCSLAKKEHQMLGRRLTMGSLLKEEHEKLTDDGFLETIIVLPEKEIKLQELFDNYQAIERSRLYHPDDYTGNSKNAYRLRILPKLGLKGVHKIHQYIKL